MKKPLLRWIRQFAGIFGVGIVSRKVYEALVFERLAREGGSGKSQSGKDVSERPDAIESEDTYRLPPAVPFPGLPDVDADTFRIHVVDVGAQPLASEQDVYMPLIRAGPCHVVGFDPFADPGLDRLNGQTVSAERTERPHVRILPYFIGNGSKARFHVNAFSPTSSLFPSNLKLMAEFSGLAEICATRSVAEVTTRRLDDVYEIESCDFLKIDVQGSDFDVIAHGSRLLDKTLFVHIEAEFAEIYTGQPLFSDIDVLLRSRNFELIDFVKLGRNNYKAFPSSTLRSRLLWSDCIYMKNPATMKDPCLLLRAAYIAHVNYRKYDLSAHLICLYDALAGTSLRDSYVETTRQRLLQALERAQG